MSSHVILLGEQRLMLVCNYAQWLDGVKSCVKHAHFTCLLCFIFSHKEVVPSINFHSSIDHQSSVISCEISDPFILHILTLYDVKYCPLYSGGLCMYVFSLFDNVIFLLCKWSSNPNAIVYQSQCLCVSCVLQVM